MSNNKNIPGDTEAYYETRAGQEELYLEQTEEEVHAVLSSDDSTPLEAAKSMTDANNHPCIAETLDEQLNHAAEELITGDSDDPPLSEETVVEMLRMAPNGRRLAYSSDV